MSLSTEAEDLLNEVFFRWSAWDSLATFLTVPGTDIRTVDPREVAANADGADISRLAALLYAHGAGETMVDAGRLTFSLIDEARQGRRPRFPAEIGLTAEALGLRPTDHARPMPPLAASHNPASRPVPTSPPGRGAPTVTTTARS